MGAGFSTPVIETERLRLRARTIDDFPFIRDMWADPQTVCYIGGKPLTEEESWTKFLRMLGHWPALGFGYWIMEERETGRAVGETGFADFKRNIKPSLAGQPEIGWAVASSAYGKGYASEAARAAVAWGDKEFSGKRMSCIIGVENKPSFRVADKCGFSIGAHTTYHGDDVAILYRDVA